MIRKAFAWWGIPTWVLLLAGLAIPVLVVALVQIWLKLRAKRREERARAEQSAQALMQTGNLREKLISLVIHDLRSPLRFLTVLASDLLDNQSNYSAEEIKEPRSILT